MQCMYSESAPGWLYRKAITSNQFCVMNHNVRHTPDLSTVLSKHAECTTLMVDFLLEC